MTQQRAFSINLGSSFTGLTLSAQPVLPDGTNTGPSLTTGFVEIGNGFYLWTTDSLADDFVGGIKFSTTGGTFLAFIDVNLAPTVAIDALTGDGSVQVDHNYGGPDALAYRTNSGLGIDNATVRVFLKTDFDAGNVTLRYRIAETTTDINGRWVNPLYLDPSVYTLVFFKQQAYGPDNVVVVVT